MEGREEQIKKVAQEKFVELWEKRLVQIDKDYRIYGKEYEEELADKILKLIRFYEEHRRETEGEPEYIIISPLNSGVVTHTYELQIACFDKNVYMEEAPCCFYWTPPFLYGEVEKDMECFYQYASKKIIRLSKGEVNEIRRRYVLFHSYSLMFFLQSVMARLNEKAEWRERRNMIRILYGTYMEQMIEIVPAEKGEG